MSENKSHKVTNFIGVFVFSLFVVGIVISKFTEGIKNHIYKSRTIDTLNDIGSRFSVKNTYVIDQWAKGVYDDAWGEDIILESTNDKIVFISKGPDKKSNTEDDIRGVTYNHTSFLSAVIKQEVKKGFWNFKLKVPKTF